MTPTLRQQRLLLAVPSGTYALTVREPWASLIASGDKRIENRTWAPPFALPFRIAVHASKRPDWTECRRRGFDPSPTMGNIIATVDVVDIVTDPQHLSPGDAAYWLGPVGWILRNPTRLDLPVPCRGRLGLWRPPT